VRRPAHRITSLNCTASRHTAAVHRLSGGIIKRVKGGKMGEFTLRIDGMHCGSCIRRVTQALGSAEGIQVEEVRLGAARLKAPSVPASVDLAIAALAKAGYTSRLEQ